MDDEQTTDLEQAHAATLQQATSRVYDEKWQHAEAVTSRVYRETHCWPWLARKYRMSLPELRELFGRAEAMLDAGCGPGDALALMADSNPTARVVGFDVSRASIDLCKQSLADRRNVELGCFSFTDLPNDLCPVDHFDIVQADDSLMYGVDAVDALRCLRQVLKPGGTLMMQAYRRLGLVREATNDALRRICHGLPLRADQWALCEILTRVGQVLFEHGGSVTVPVDVATSLGCRPGLQSLHEFVYAALFQCHWDWTLVHRTVKENAIAQFDWLVPPVIERWTPEETARLVSQAGLTLTWMGVGEANHKGISVVATK